MKIEVRCARHNAAAVGHMPEWFFKLGSLAGLLTFGMSMYDRLLRHRPTMAFNHCEKQLPRSQPYCLIISNPSPYTIVVAIHFDRAGFNHWFWQTVDEAVEVIGGNDRRASIPAGSEIQVLVNVPDAFLEDPAELVVVATMHWCRMGGFGFRGVDVKARCGNRDLAALPRRGRSPREIAAV